MNKEATEIWSQWPEALLIDDYAQKRIKSAKTKKLTPLSIDSESNVGIFQGSHGRYITYLDHCPCGDFVRSKRPCKHMFRLAMELGLLNCEYQSDAASIVPIRRNQKPFEETLDLIETFSDDVQMYLLEVIRSMTNENPKKQVSECDELKALVSADLLEIISGPEGTKNLYTVVFSKEHKRDKVHKYLHRKYDDDINYFTEVTLEGSTELQKYYPDDDITEQLKKRGYIK